MSTSKSHKGEITEENRVESQKLKAIYEQRKKSGWLAERGITSQEAFGAKFDIGNQGAVWQCLNASGAKISKKQAAGFARGLECAVSDFSPRLAAEIDALGSSPAEDDEFALVKRAAVKFSAGRGQLVFHEGSKSALSFRREFLREIGVSVENAVIVSVDGNSMDPTLKHGSVLLLNRAPAAKIANGQVYAFRYDGELLVKRLFQIDGGYLAVSDNPDRVDYPDIKITDPDEFDMIGRALWAGTRL